MVAKVKINEYGDCVFSEQDIIDILYQNPKFDLTKIYFDIQDRKSNHLFTRYNSHVDKSGLDLPKINHLDKRPSLEEFDKQNCEKWWMPQKYYELNVRQWLLDRCQTEEEKARVDAEYILFEKKKFIQVLQFLIYFVDTLRENNIVWGVGRGSSVSSFCLFLIGIHKINPLLYNLDYTEFLR